MKIKIEYVPVADSFIGIKVVYNKLHFYYPETFNFKDGNEIEIREQIIEILKTFMLTKRSNESSSLNSKFIENTDYPLISYLWILQDYLDNHRYINRENFYRNNGKGKINWKKTIKQIPYISNESFVYCNFVTEGKRNADTLITDIYKYCVTQSIKILGCLFNIDIDSYLKTHRHEYNKALFITAIKKELGETFDDIKRIRLSHMLNILTGLDDEIINSNIILYGIDKYDVIYEKMLFNLFSNIKDIKEFYPSADWFLLTDNKTKKSSNLRPDIVMVNEKLKKAYILDAKYYRFGSTFNRSDLPDSSSIQKQITYGEYVKKLKLSGFEVFNAFLMPYNRFAKNQYGFSNILEFVGKAKIKWSSEDVNNEIIGILIDTNFVIANWSGNGGAEIDNLCKIIENNASLKSS